jgi:dephospho-CoA kinase
MKSVKPLVIGLTGSIAMGKSAVADMFKECGVPVFDADAEVHILQGPQGALLAEIESAFPGTTGPQGVDRQKLGALVFGKPAALAQLEAIIHPRVAELRRKFLKANDHEKLVVFDIPLLFEKGGEKAVDHIVVASASAEQQRERALARPGMTAEKFERILALQMPDNEKRKMADFVIDTGTDIASTRKQVRKLVDQLRSTLAQLKN